jgi:hypothetical protein
MTDILKTNGQFCHVKELKLYYTVIPAHVVTSIKQSPVLKGHIFLFLSGQKKNVRLLSHVKNV